MYRSTRDEIAQVIAAWLADPIHMATNVGVSFLLGQGLFWRLGYDQLSIGGKRGRIMEIGQGQRVARLVYDRIPHSQRAIFAAKALEIVGDVARCYTERATLRRTGLAPDAVACAVTQPLWSAIEASEKVYAVIRRLDDYRELDEQEFLTSIACSYGNLFRFAQDLLLVLFADEIEHYLRQPIENVVRRHPRTIITLAVAGAAYHTTKAIRGYRAAKAA